MEIVGTIAAILDETLVLLKTSSKLSVGTTLTVFAAVKLPSSAAAPAPSSLYLPKGDIRLVLQQPEENIYIAERFQQSTVTKKRRPTSAWLNPLAEAFEEIDVVSKGPWSAEFDDSQSLKLDFPKGVQVGDPVGTK